MTEHNAEPPLRWETLAESTDSEQWARDDYLEFRLDKFGILSADALAWILSIACWRTAFLAAETAVVLPHRKPTLAFLADVGFIERFQNEGGFFRNEEVLWDPEIDRQRQRLRRSDRSPLSPHFVQRVDVQSWDDVVGALHRYVKDDVVEALGVLPGTDVADQARPFGKAAGELIHNVACHTATTRSAGVGFTCYRRWAKNNRTLRFSCSDIGSGFLATMRMKDLPPALQPIRSDADAVLAGILYRFFVPNTAVVGLYQALDFLADFRGSLRIRSGTTLLILDLNDPSVLSAFRRGYETPTMRWLKEICRIEYRGPVEGTHVVLDMIRRA